MTRPTPGREAPPSPPGQHHTFPAILASALDRTAHRDRPGRLDPGGRPVVDVRPALADRAAVGDRPVPACHAGPAGDGLPAGGPDAADRPIAGPPAPDAAGSGVRSLRRFEGVPGTDEVRLADVVGEESAPLWCAFLPGRDRVARERLVDHYAWLVRGVGSKLAVRLPASIELADLVQSGTFGLMDAVDRFDPRRAVRFDGYAAQRVRGAMLDELRAQDWVPRTVRARSREVERARETVASRTGRPPTDRELAAELGVGLRELRHAVRPLHLVSVEMLDQAEGSRSAVADLVVDDTAPDPVVVAVRRETGRELRAAVAQLGERDRLVLRLYYLENRTLAEIGSVLGVTESRVCQLHSRMVSRLRGRLETVLAS